MVSATGAPSSMVYRIANGGSYSTAARLRRLSGTKTYNTNINAVTDCQTPPSHAQTVSSPRMSSVQCLGSQLATGSRRRRAEPTIFNPILVYVKHCCGNRVGLRGSSTRVANGYCNTLATLINEIQIIAHFCDFATAKARHPHECER